MPAFAGPFSPQDDPIPQDKKLSPAWIDSLTARGQQAVYSGSELRWIGMPIGGIGAGTVYLGGDGKLWLWDIFNQPHEGVESKTIEYLGQTVRPRDGSNYVQPVEPTSPFELGFTLKIEGEEPRPMDRTGWKEVRFTGEYPIGRVSYRDPDCPLEVELEAFSPWVPLGADDSSWPGVVVNWRVRNITKDPVGAFLRCHFENPVLLNHRETPGAVLKHQITAGRDGHRGGRVFAGLTCSVAADAAPESSREDIHFEGFEGEDYGSWRTEGSAFGSGPTRAADLPAYQGEVSQEGARLVNSHNTRSGEDVRGGDAHTGALISPTFVIGRRFIHFLVGGGAHSGKTCVQLLVKGEVVRETSGKNENRLRAASWEVPDLEGSEAEIRVLDLEAGGWGNVGFDEVVFSDTPRAVEDLEDLPDFGHFAVLTQRTHAAHQGAIRRWESQDGRPRTLPRELTTSLKDGLRGVVGRWIQVAPWESETIALTIAWDFPNSGLPGKARGKRGSNKRWRAGSLTRLARQASRLGDLTRRWRDTWYDSTLPWWLLDRTMATASTLATTTCHRLADGRFWGWEGIGCCAGTCTHVWHYAQAMGRLFPSLERALREKTDFAAPAFDPKTGRIDFRGGLAGRWASDGQAGVVLRSLREHQMSADDLFLRRNWKSIRAALRFLMNQDAADGKTDGALDGEQHNTLDAEWYGRVPHLTGLYIAALAAGAEMAEEVGDGGFAGECRARLETGKAAMMECFDGESFLQLEDPAHLDDIAVGRGVHIDQVMGQWWAHQLGLGRLWDGDATRSALGALWKHNFVPDMGELRATLAPKVRGRPYAIAGDAGLVMCTWPKGGRRADWEKHWQYMYFNECMSGFEYQAAAHMIHEGLVTEGLAVTRAVHDRYHPRLRNPYNEVECSDHYARAMASYGVYLAVCGYEYHGPKGRLGFAPKIRPEDFRCAFTAAEGWGTYWQRYEEDGMRCGIELKFGRLTLRRLTVEAPSEAAITRVTRGDADLPFRQAGRRITIEVEPTEMSAGQSMEIQLQPGSDLD